jgi:hypothetical protein
MSQTANKPSAPRKPAKPVQAVQIAPERELTAAELEVASRVYVGRLPCELGQTITITPDAKSPGYFDLTLKKTKFRMHAVQSKSGAVRLDAVSSDATWIQLSNKSMLVNAKVGQRMADACASPEQLLVAQAFEKAPPPSLFDEPAPAAMPTKVLTQTDACQADGLSVPKTYPLNGEKTC